MNIEDTKFSRRHVLSALAAGIVGSQVAGRGAFAQAYPSRPIKLLVGYPPGGGADILARIFANKLSPLVGQPVVVENRPGAGSTIAAAALASAPPDGYTLFFAESGILVGTTIYDKVGYDPLTLTPVGIIGNLPYSLVVNPSFPAQNVRELIDVLKASPGKYSYASPGVGNIAHLSAEMFQKEAGVQIVHVPYKGGTPALADLVGGQIPICFVSLPPALALARSGKLRLLAVTSTKRSPVSPDTPAIAETLPGFNSVASIFLLAPPGTPAPIVERANAAMREVMAMKDVQSDFVAQGATVETSSPQALATLFKDELASWGSIVKSANVKME
ncbi:tripartite tricarboxylate transporter substrate binding protein [Reyranella aquatilis]|uniref:Tripartite tricarboxylate transporter substrate binding protein n=1 Tax=Reyranella aquatilis TaxID=2035356 RepID=A0ABS8L2S8_9HYPH|nr:tripartite tricarboxylate transporter substrate binding protein [Reyranella aquatilis]MCC8432629.1 tripartite tricarboxylate transporter substrate binding protein [Reyranella aquatilis]